MNDRPWLIWSIEHNAWWRPNRMGYTPDRSSAGRYSDADAREIVRIANKYLQDDQDPNESLVPYEN